MHRDPYHQQILPCVPHLSRAALRLTRGAALADDLVQETLVRAWQARDSFQPGTNARAWTQRILFNTYVNHYRKNRREREAPGRGGAPKLAHLTARGDLRALLRLMALRAGISLRRKSGRLALTDDDRIFDLAGTDDAPSLVFAKESASDLVQSVCLEILQHLDRFRYRGEAGFKHWLYTTALRRIVNKHEFNTAAKRDVRRDAR